MPLLPAMGLVETDLLQEQVGPLKCFESGNHLHVHSRIFKEVCILQKKHLFTWDDCTFTHIYSHTEDVFSCR